MNKNRLKHHLPSFRAAAMAASIGAALMSAPVAADFKVIGYFPSWAGDAGAIPYDKLTHINYSFVLPNADGSLRPLDGGGARLADLVRRAHSNGVKVLISIGGWNDGNDSAFVSLAANSGSRANFVNQVVNFLNQYNLDGADIDWEYPDAGWEADNFRLLMQDLSRALKTRGKLLTAAVTAYDQPGSVDRAVIDAVDFLNLMVYDMGYPHSTYQHAQNALSHWRSNEGLPKDKTVLGLPFYSHKDWVPYNEVIRRHGEWAAQVDNAGGLDYNGQPTIRAKSELALNESGGVMFWELSQDTRDHTSLLGTIWDVVGDAVDGGGSGGGTGNPQPPNGTHPQWQAGQWYNVGDIVTYKGQSYIVVNANPGYDPVISHWFWDPYSGGGKDSGTVANLTHGHAYKITARHSGKVLDVSGRSHQNGADVHQWNYVGGNNQKWVALDKGNGRWQLRALHSGKCLDVDAWGQQNGANLHQWSCHDGANQQFRLDSQGGGFFQLRNGHSDRCVDVKGVSQANGASAHQWSCQGQTNAQWKFEAVQ